jgi:hypothetical protein
MKSGIHEVEKSPSVFRTHLTFLIFLLDSFNALLGLLAISELHVPHDQPTRLMICTVRYSASTYFEMSMVLSKL